MGEKLKELFQEWCFEQSIYMRINEPVTFADLASFLDYVELMTDELTDDGR